ncbi:amino acid/amide ABC transporter membrane protein 1, HAAT family [Succinivibrio dextrinosolvens]|uniref:Amino acid/amide ABC transporter membrane protein 1, HAAT family n=2 Tax=Succinivibrio dextrinosolvens TaxID=83771 RepID=A0A662ZDA0_9GAMM|nr:urea ABC transporter permease subunit UrtB [Succinivibrio dextrinosolvens]SFK13218.1 amino acid/amide ABC transporter membrane protein 1, HAAT family [Succinivibrio dextrinosolvens]
MKISMQKAFCMLLTVLFISTVYAAEPDYEISKSLKDSLTDSKAKSRDNAIAILSEDLSEQNILVLNKLKNGLVYYDSQKEIFLKESVESNCYIQPSTSQKVCNLKLRRSGISTLQKKKIESILLKSALFSSNDSDRAKAVKKLLEIESQNDLPSEETIDKLIRQESQKEIYKDLKIVEALIQSRSPELGVQKLISCIDILEEKGNAACIQAIDRLKLSTNSEVSQRATKAASSLSFSKSISDFFEKIFFGLSLGSVLVLAAVGLSITFGVMGVINMAHGELIMLGAYTVWIIQQIMPQSMGLALFISIPCAFIVSAFFGILIEHFVIRHLSGRPLETLLATFGISLILQQLVRTLFSPLNRAVATPEFLQGSVQITSNLSITCNRLSIIFFSLVVFAVIVLVMKKTRLGLEVRAVSQNRAIAKAMGIKAEKVDVLTFGLGSGIAGVAGVALSQITNVGPNLGQSYIIDSFMVVVFGGAGNLWGTLTGGLIMGIANKLLEPVSGAMLSKIIILIALILFIQKRPRGLFPQRGRAAED